MRVFVDTSSLFKKYLDEPGSESFEKVLIQTTEIVVSPLTWIEIHSAIERNVRSRLLPHGQAEQLRMDIGRDFVFFRRILWNENLEKTATEIIRKHALKSLDSIQLASAVLSEADLFITSDKKLYQEAKKIIKHSQFI